MDLADDEGVIYVKPEKNVLWRNIPAGCLFFLHPGKKWQANMVITNKRLVTIPMPKYQKKYTVESYYFKDMTGARTISAKSKEAEAAIAQFAVEMKPGGSSSYVDGGEFWVCYEFTAKNFLKVMKASQADFNANYPYAKSGLAVFQASAATVANKAAAENRAAATGGVAYWTEVAPNYGKMTAAAKARAEGMDFSKEGHAQLRDFIVDMINQFVEVANS